MAYQNNTPVKPKEKLEITEVNYVDVADKVMNALMSNRCRLTTSQLRNILSMVSELYNQAILVKEDTLPMDIQSSIQYLKLRIVYEVGRSKAKDYGVYNFIVNAQVIEQLDKVKQSKKQLLLFCRYMEALVAYHKFYGGRD